MDSTSMPKPFVGTHQWYLATLFSVPSTAGLVYSYSHVIDELRLMAPLELSSVQSCPVFDWPVPQLHRYPGVVCTENNFKGVMVVLNPSMAWE
ncbi:unnamed protein product [Linum tenue]|uniref:Uncharacterized protein n=1 Tax=Linum tenue TaxID=586396 RepID=A0AAV0NG74_9ROSI|nr:unnamed protein product [Linum tenue]